MMVFQAIPSPATVAAGAATIAIAIKPVCELIAKSHHLPNPYWKIGHGLAFGKPSPEAAEFS